MATLQRDATDTDSLYELERGTQDIVTVIMQNAQMGGGTVKIPGVEKVTTLHSFFPVISLFQGFDLYRFLSF